MELWSYSVDSMPLSDHLVGKGQENAYNISTE